MLSIYLSIYIYIYNPISSVLQYSMCRICPVIEAWRNPDVGWKQECQLAARRLCVLFSAVALSYHGPTTFQDVHPRPTSKSNSEARIQPLDHTGSHWYPLVTQSRSLDRISHSSFGCKHMFHCFSQWVRSLLFWPCFGVLSLLLFRPWHVLASRRPLGHLHGCFDRARSATTLPVGCLACQLFSYYRLSGP